MKGKTDKQTIKSFLTLYLSKILITTYLVIFTGKDHISRYYDITDIDYITEQCENLASNDNVYFNLLLQDAEKAKELWIKDKRNDGKPYRGRGYKETTAVMTCVWLDIDVKHDKHSQDKLPETFDEAIAFAKSLSLKPTVIVKSGHGLHVYWFFEEPWVFQNDNDRQEAEYISKGFQEYARALAKVKEWIIDNTQDLMRMLRVPGTINWKDKDNPIPVEIIEINDANIYSVEDFRALLEDNKPDKAITTNDNMDSKVPEIAMIEGKCSFVKYCKEYGKSLPEPWWYAWICLMYWCKDGEQYIHSISSQYPRYSEEETQKKIEQASKLTGATTCQYISEITSDEFCKDCPYKNSTNSPVSLGYESHMTYEEALEKAKDIICQVKSGNKGAHLEENAIKVYAIIYSNSLAEFERLKEEIKDAGAKVQNFITEVKKRVAELKNQQTSKQGYEAKMVSINTDDGEKQIIVPPGYRLKPSGIYKVHIGTDNREWEELIAHKPILINKKYKNIEESGEMVEIAWREYNGWTSTVIDRGIMCDSKKIISLSSSGFPVSSINTGEIIAYLSEFEAVNDSNFPRFYVSNHLGWVGKSESRSFLLGNMLIDVQGNIIDILDENQREHETSSGIVTFQGQTPGDEQIAKGFGRHGSFDKWKEIIEIIRDYDRVLLIFYASFAPVLLEPLKASNFVIELANKTSTGKTTALRVAASVWGSPDERQPNCIISSWDLTNVYLEKASSILQSLPLILDDTKRAKNQSQVAQIIYSVANGRGRARGNKTSTAITKSWKTILISTGETPSIYFTKDGGTRARVLEITGKPFGDTNEKTRKDVNKLNLEMRENYGFAGPMFVKYVIEHKDDWDEWKKRFRDIEKDYAERFTDGVSGRLCEYLALIKFTAEMANKALGLDFNVNLAIEGLINGIIEESKDSTGEKAALQYVMSWANSHSQSFRGREETEDKQPYGGWAGKWMAEDSWEYIAFYPSILQKIIEEAGYDYEAILRGWKEMGFLDVKDNSPRKYSKQIRSGSSPEWLIPIKRSAVDSLEEDGESRTKNINSIENRLF